MFQFIHTADFHLDSAFSSLTPEEAAARRQELRELPARLAAYANRQHTDLVLLAGDLLDVRDCYRETLETLVSALGQIDAPVFIAPGNHDWYGPDSPYALPNRYSDAPWPPNVHVFQSAEIERVEVPALHTAVYGAAFTGPTQSGSLLTGFSAPKDGLTHLMVLHGDLNDPAERYNPIRRDEVADSGLTYLALGHTHQQGGMILGGVPVAWPGSPESRGFDETGEKGFYEGRVEDSGQVRLRFVPFARHRCEIVTADVTEQTPLDALEALLPQRAERTRYRVCFRGETERPLDLDAIRTALDGRYEGLDLRDETRRTEDPWARLEEDSLRGAFLRNLRSKLDAAQTEEARQEILLAVKFGLLALDHRDFS